MDYAQEIAQNNARIAELQEKLQAIKSRNSMGTDEMDYQLAAQRASYGDMPGAQYHLNKPDERKRMEQLRIASEGAFASDTEYQYAKLKDAVEQAEDDFALVPPENTRVYNRMKQKLENAKLNLKIFEKRNPNLTKMHWNWANQVGGTSAENQQPPQAPVPTIQGGKAQIDDLIMVGQDGNVYLKEGADIEPVIDYFKKIPYWYENEDARKTIQYLKGLKTPKAAANAPTVANAEIFKLDPDKFSGNLWVDSNAREEAQARYDALPIEQKNTKEGMAFKAALNKWTKAEFAQWKKEMHAEGKKQFDSLPSGMQDLAKAEKKFNKDGREWTMKDGEWETDSKWRKK